MPGFYFTARTPRRMAGLKRNAEAPRSQRETRSPGEGSHRLFSTLPLRLPLRISILLEEPRRIAAGPETNGMDESWNIRARRWLRFSTLALLAPWRWIHHHPRRRASEGIWIRQGMGLSVWREPQGSNWGTPFAKSVFETISKCIPASPAASFIPSWNFSEWGEQETIS